MSILIYKQRHRHPNYKKTPKGNYAHIGYIATRPGAVKNEGVRHGLFGKLEPGAAVKEFDTWQEAARLVRELSYRRVNMYRGIISFSPETAAELGLSDHKAWEDYIDRHILTLAKFNGIRVQDLQWVAAHHNEKGHPHIHVVFWNKHQRTMVPFVHPSIPDKIRKQLIRDTFAERIKAYCEDKQQAKEHLSAITDEMIDEFEKYGRVCLTTEDGTAGERGFVTNHSVLDEIRFDRIATCGPKPMMVAVAKYAKARGIECEVSLENKMACGVGACLCCVEKTADGNVCVCKEGPVININKLLWQI